MSRPVRSLKLIQATKMWGTLVLVILITPRMTTFAADAIDGLPSPPRFSRTRGFYEAPLSVELSSAETRASIWYTTNGDPPVAGQSQRYAGPIPIRTTSILRAACAVEGTSSPSITHTYIFLRDVVDQTGKGFPMTWGTNHGQAVKADYEMDPEITGPSGYQTELMPALRAVPVLSLVMAEPDLFDWRRGIYANPQKTGAEWERAASLELIYPEQSGGLQINCGARIQGGWNRRPEESPKHSFRIVFKKRYGPGKLRFPLFGEVGAREFDEVILRAGCNNTWLHWNGEERRRGDFIRDQWMRETFAAMGHPSARGIFVHLYLNGLYWGLYNPTERPSAPFVAWHFGGKPEHFDVRNADNVVEGDEAAWRRLMATANAGVTKQGEYEAIEELLDIAPFIDFMILNFYGANADWDRGSNWYAARRRQPPGPYQFFIWDGERVLESVTDNSMAADDDQSPTRLFHQLKENAGFRRQFAARAHQHLTGDGALTPAMAAERYRRWSSRLDLAVIGESARWGDYRRDVHRYKAAPYELYTRDGHWRPEIRRILEDYFPRRSAAVIEQFRQAGLY
jgi:hypothetical protein